MAASTSLRVARVTANPIFTVGHSNRELSAFMQLVSENELDLVIDVRKLAGSTRYPQFNADTLEAALGEIGVGLRRLEPLTGRRLVSKTVPFEVNAWWQNRSFHNYADHALSPEFCDALHELRHSANERRVAVMCSEAVWWRCHRRIIADHLLAAGEQVRHILGSKQAQDAKLSDGAVVGAEGLPQGGAGGTGCPMVTYPALATG